MRALRPYLPEAVGVRVNAICPWMTATQIVAGIEDSWYAAKLPVNQPSNVAKVLLDVTQTTHIHGKAFYIEGGRAWEIEDNINRLEPQWLGEKQSEDLERGQQTLGNVRGSYFSFAARKDHADDFSGFGMDEQAIEGMTPSFRFRSTMSILYCPRIKLYIW